jgi:hypothetical protein
MFQRATTITPAAMATRHVAQLTARGFELHTEAATRIIGTKDHYTGSSGTR